MSIFAPLSPRLQEAIVGRLGWTSLCPVQKLDGEGLLSWWTQAREGWASAHRADLGTFERSC